MPKGRTGQTSVRQRTSPENGGVPTSKLKAMLGVDIPEMVIPERTESDGEIEARLTQNFMAMDIMVSAVALGKARAMIISGPPGLGKSYGVAKILEKVAAKGVKAEMVRGFAHPTGMYKTLYEYRDSKSCVVFDDCDSAFLDEGSLNLLKTACDTTRTRKLSWLAETHMKDGSSESLPNSFEFEGSIIFITNYDFDYLIAKSKSLGPHFEALQSRSYYLDLDIKTPRDRLIRIKQVVKMGGLKEHGVNPTQEYMLMAFLEKHAAEFRELSIRTLVKLVSLMRIHDTRWQALAKAVMFKRVRVA